MTISTPSDTPSPSLQQFNSLSTEQQALFLESINWSRLIPAGIALIKQIQDGNLVTDWGRTLDIIKEILDSLSQAEQQSMLKIDWATLIPIILKFILPILIGIGGTKEPIEV